MMTPCMGGGGFGMGGGYGMDGGGFSMGGDGADMSYDGLASDGSFGGGIGFESMPTGTIN